MAAISRQSKFAVRQRHAALNHIPGNDSRSSATEKPGHKTRPTARSGSAKADHRVGLMVRPFRSRRVKRFIVGCAGSLYFYVQARAHANGMAFKLQTLSSGLEAYHQANNPRWTFRFQPLQWLRSPSSGGVQSRAAALPIFRARDAVRGTLVAERSAKAHGGHRRLSAAYATGGAYRSRRRPAAFENTCSAHLPFSVTESGHLTVEGG